MDRNYSPGNKQKKTSVGTQFKNLGDAITTTVLGSLKVYPDTYKQGPRKALKNLDNKFKNLRKRMDKRDSE